MKAVIADPKLTRALHAVSPPQLPAFIWVDVVGKAHKEARTVGISSREPAESSAAEQPSGSLEWFKCLNQELKLEDNDWFLPELPLYSHQYLHAGVFHSFVKGLWTGVFQESGATYAVHAAEPQTVAGHSASFDLTESILGSLLCEDVALAPEDPVRPSVLELMRLLVQEESSLDREARHFESRLLDVLSLQHVDEGYTHPAERLLEEALVTQPQQAVTWIESAYWHQAASDPVLAAELLKCIAQLPGIDHASWPIPIASHALSSGEIQLREAGVRVFESWGDLISAHYLESYVQDEPVPWLADYARDVLLDINSRR